MQPKGYRCVLSDFESGEIGCWTVRGVSGEQPSIWSVRIDGQEVATEEQSFNMPNIFGVGSTGAHVTLAKAFQAFRLCLGRVLALLQHLDRLGVESMEEYRNWCQSHRLSPELASRPANAAMSLILWPRPWEAPTAMPGSSRWSTRRLAAFTPVLSATQLSQRCTRGVPFSCRAGGPYLRRSAGRIGAPTPTATLAWQACRWI